MRLDIYLYKNGYTTSRNRAKYLIINQKVKVSDKIINKTSYDIKDEEVIILEETIYVSRAAYKLKLFFDKVGMDVKGLKCLDIGSSTGGFVQILCEYGAKSVTAVDVGSDQLSQTLRDNVKVKSFEKTDIREFKSENCFEFVTCDVSFVGLSYIINEIQLLSCDKILILFKPQFEVGRDIKRDKKGVVKDFDAVQKACEKFESSTEKLGWKQTIKEKSQIKGKNGNEEIFYYFTK